jgi:hypothetical protein
MAKTVGQPTGGLRQILKVAGPRPQTAVWEDAITLGLSLFTLTALYWDGLYHNNRTGIDHFWTSAHIAMYVGLTSVGAWIALVLMRHQPVKGRLTISLQAVPYGYGLAFVALPLAGIGGPADFIWHSIYGFENQVDAPFSPTHQLLFLAGALLSGITMASSYRRGGRTPSLKEIAPGIVSATVIVGVVEFVFMHLQPFFWTMVPTKAFQNDLARYADAYKPGTGVTHIEGLFEAVGHYGDQPFPYYFFANMQLIGGIMIFTAVFVSMVMYLRRRWVLPFGSLTIMCTILGLEFPILSEYKHPEFVVTLVAAGVLGDVLQRVLMGAHPTRVLRIRAFAGLFPILLWGLYLITEALTKSGLGWNITLWLGVLTTSAGVGYGIAMISFPPPMPKIAELADAERA